MSFREYIACKYSIFLNQGMKKKCWANFLTLLNQHSKHQTLHSWDATQHTFVLRWYSSFSLLSIIVSPPCKRFLPIFLTLSYTHFSFFFFYLMFPSLCKRSLCYHTLFRILLAKWPSQVWCIMKGFCFLSHDCFSDTHTRYTHTHVHIYTHTYVHSNG